MKVEEIFKANFLKNSIPAKKIVLYGLGKDTEKILGSDVAEHIWGVLDGYRTSGEFCGKPILELESLVGNDFCIVIIARKASLKVIYRRISKYCRANEISIYDIEGNMLTGNTRLSEKEWECGTQTMQELLEKIRKYDCVSFDIFDTLLVRKTACVEDVFECVGSQLKEIEDFSKVRIYAEKELSGEETPDIYRIYERICELKGLPKEKKFAFARSEFEIDSSFIIARKDMVNLMNLSVEMGKEVYLISDMYYDEDMISELLCKEGITNYLKLYISCVYNKSKKQGLYENYKQEVQGKRCIHIGDAHTEDGQCPKKYGIDSYIIKTSMDLGDTWCGNYGLAESVQCARMQGMVNAQLFNSPFAFTVQRREVWVDSPQQFGYAVMGPLFFIFVLWLIENVKKRNVEKMFFLSRDGFLVEKIYSMLREASEEKFAESEYLLCSRSLGSIATVFDEKDIEKLCALPFEGSNEEMLMQRFYLKHEEIRCDETEKSEDRTEVVLKHIDIILERSAQLRQNYLTYLKAINMEGRKKAIFDFVSSGTCQACLERLLDEKMQGLYFERVSVDDERRSELLVDGFVEDIGAEVDEYFLMEVFIKAIVPSIHSFSSQIEPIYCVDKMNSENKTVITDVQDGVLEYVGDCLKQYTCWSFDEELGNYAKKILADLNENRILLKDINFQNIKNYDIFTNRIIEFS